MEVRFQKIEDHTLQTLRDRHVPVTHDGAWTVDFPSPTLFKQEGRHTWYQLPTGEVLVLWSPNARLTEWLGNAVETSSWKNLEDTTRKATMSLIKQHRERLDQIEEYFLKGGLTSEQVKNLLDGKKG